MVTLGLGEIVGGLFIGQIVDKLGNKVASYVNILLIALCTLITVMFLYQNKFNMLVFAMTFMWGFSDSGVNTHLSEILGFEFENNSEPYSIFNLV
jgi:predicted MFS family arabinose efflux permease